MENDIKTFKGYYFKCGTHEEAIAFILAVHGRSRDNTDPIRNRRKQSASLQIITPEGTCSIPITGMKFCHTPDRLVHIKAGASVFSGKGIRLNINTGGIRATGKIKFTNIYKISSPIMGPFRYLPFLQCRHDILSMAHDVSGKITINQKDYLFADGTGYIESDKGYSFPSEYAWTQCRHENISLMLAVADIPILGFHFLGVIGAICIDGREYRLATYLGAKAEYIGDKTLVISQGKYRFMASLLREDSVRLAAPQHGKMKRQIRESVRCTARYRFEWKDEKMFDFHSDEASFEYEFQN